jgi:hypothetical protein
MKKINYVISHSKKPQDQDPSVRPKEWKMEMKMAGCFESGNEPSGSIKCREFLD